MKPSVLALTIALVAGAQGCAAMVVAGPAGAPEPGRRSIVATPAPGTNAAAIEYVTAIVDSVSPDRRSIVVRGKPLALHPTQLQVFVGSQAATLGVLRPGQTVRLALESSVAGADPRRVVVIHAEP